MRGDLLERLRGGEVLVSHITIHGLAEEKGRDLAGHLSEWIVDHPEDFQDLIKATCAAGSDFGTTATQGNIRYRLRGFGLEDRLYELTLKQTQLAREATPKNCHLKGIISTTGRILESAGGDMTVDELYESYKEVIIPLLEGGVDVLELVENDTEQVVVGIRALRDLCDIPVIALNFLYHYKTGIKTLMGVDSKTAAARFQEAGADIIGACCYGGAGFTAREDAVTIIEETRQGCDKPIIIMPNQGSAQEIDGKTIYPVTPEQTAKAVPDWIAAGASIVGGVAGTSLDHLRAISAAVRGEEK